MDIYRISIPKKDKIFADWMSAQTNPSLSMRLLIRHFIDENGVEDVFNAFGMELVTKGRGRPRKADVVYKVPTEPVVEVSAVSAHGESVIKSESDTIIIAPPHTEKGAAAVNSAELIDEYTAKSIKEGGVITMSDSPDEKQKDIISEMDKMKGLMNG